MKKLFKFNFFISFIFIKTLIVILVFKRFGYQELGYKFLNQKGINGIFCKIDIDTTEESFKLFIIAKKLDIKLFICEPQRLYKYLNEQEIKSIQKSEFLSVIDRNYKKKNHFRSFSVKLQKKSNGKIFFFKYLIKT
jgi:hypothetical protein